MQPLNLLDLIFKPFIIPFSSFHPFLPLSILCYFYGLIGLYFYKSLTNQENLKFIHKNIKLIHLEMRIRPNDPRELSQLLGKVIGWNLLYLKNALLPSLIIIIPLCCLLLPIESHFAHYPIRVGNVFSVEIVQNPKNNKIQPIQLTETPVGLELIESGRVPGPKTISGWYFRAKRNGLYHLKFHSDGWIATKRIIVSDSIQPINKTLKPSNWLDYLYLFEKRLIDKTGSIESISVSYENATFPILGFSLNWLSYFILVFIIFLLMIKSLMQVY